ncbi:MAG: flagellar basal body L-ring protein FlgH [Desulfobulbus sp.]|nr:flagellar basal body L-ring protein FlgH [Desulfobulbus sp.]
MKSTGTRRLTAFLKIVGAGRHWGLCILCIVLLAGCTSTRNIEVAPVTEPLEEPVSGDAKPQSPGTLWNGDEGNWLADIKARRAGDIVTVIIAEQATASKEATTDTDRSSSVSAGISSLFGLEKSVADSNANITPSSLISASSANKFSGGGKTTRSENLAATLTTQVIKVYPNGNLKIRGGKSVTVNNENQIIYLTGIVRSYDVTADNTVNSGDILNAQITYTGKGALSDKQKPGWLMRIFDNTWPF